MLILTMSETRGSMKLFPDSERGSTEESSGIILCGHPQQDSLPTHAQSKMASALNIQLG